MARRRVPRGGERLKCPPLRFGHIQRNNYFNFGVLKRLRLRSLFRTPFSRVGQCSKAVRHSPDGLAALIGKDRSGDGNCYFARPSFFSRFHARMTCTLVTRLPGKNTRAPVSLQCYVCIQCTTIYPLWTVLGMNRPANALKRPGAPHAPAKTENRPVCGYRTVFCSIGIMGMAY